MKTNTTGLVVGQKETFVGVTYIVTKGGIERLEGDRKQRRAKEAELRKAGQI